MEIQRTIIELDLQREGARRMTVTSPAPRGVWSQLVASDLESLVFQTPAWTDAICAGGEYVDASRLYEFPDGHRLLLPMVRKTGLPAWFSTESSLPASWGMGGLISEGKIRTNEVAAVFKDLRRRMVLRTSIRINPLVQKTWAAAKPRAVTVKPMLAHVLDLEGGFERVWSDRFVSETRTAVRKAEHSGLTVELDTTGRLIPVFYQLFQRSVDRWSEMQNEPHFLAHWRASHRDPIEKFYDMARSIGDAFRLWVAWKDGQPAAAILVLLGRNASYTRGAMDKALAGPTRANQLLHRMAIGEAANAGCRWYHMGESGTSSSLAQFKSRFGARPVEYGEYWIEKLPITTIDRNLRGMVKKLIGFKDAE